MSAMKLTDLPFSVLLDILQYFIYSPNEAPGFSSASGNHIEIKKKAFQIKWGERNPLDHKKHLIRLVCRTFRDIIDSASFWAGKNMCISRSRRLESQKYWSFLEKCGIQSLTFIHRFSLSHSKVQNLNKIRNLKHLSFNCSAEKGFDFFKLMTDMQLQSLELLNVRRWHLACFEAKEEFENFLANVAFLENSLKELKLEACIKDFKQMEISKSKKEVIAEIKTRVPNLQSVVLRQYLDINTLIESVPPKLCHLGSWKTVKELFIIPYDDVIRQFMSESVTKVAATCVAPKSIHEEIHDKFEDNGSGELEQISLVLYSKNPDRNLEAAKLIHSLVNLEKLVIRKGSFIDMPHEIQKCRKLTEVVLGRFNGETYVVASDHHIPIKSVQSRMTSGLPTFLSSICSLNLTRIVIYSQVLLTDHQISLLASVNGQSIQEMGFLDCPNISDSSLFSLKVRFPNLVTLYICYCKGIDFSFLLQNYQHVTEMPLKLRKVVIRFWTFQDSPMAKFLEAMQIVRHTSRNRVRLECF